MTGRALLTLLLVTLVFAPMAWGAVETWSLAVVEALSFALLALLCRDRLRGGRPPFRSVPGLLPLALLTAWAALQAVPLPPSMTPFSLSAKRTLGEFFRLAACGALYVSAVQLLAEKRALRRAVDVVAVFGALLAFGSIVQHLLPGDFYFSLRELKEGRPFGPFVNRNHYAALMGMIFPVVFGLYLYHRPRAGPGTFVEKVRDMVTGHAASAHFLAGLAGLVIVASLVVSLSRGAIIGLASAMIVFGAAFSLRGGRGRWRVSALLLVGLSFVYIGWFGWEAVVERFEMLRDPARVERMPRPKMWADTLLMVRDRPAAGSGFGAFEDVYPSYRSLPGTDLLQHAHNDYLEFLAGGGAVAAGLALWFLAAVLATSVGMLLRRRDLFAFCVCWGAVAGVLAMLVHSLFEFNLQTGADALWFFFLLALAVSAAHTRMQGRNQGTLLPAAPSARLPRALGAGAAALLAAGLLFNGGIVLADRWNPGAARFATSFPSAGEAQSAWASALRAALVDPLEGDHHFTAANAALALGDLEGARAELEKALRLAPVRARYHQRLGLVLSELGLFEEADSSFRLSVEHDRVNPLRRRVYGSWLLSRGRREEGLGQLRSALAMEPEKGREYVALLVLNGFEDWEILRALSGLPEALLGFGDYLAATGREPMAEDARLEALAAEEGAAEPKAARFLRVSQHFAKEKRYDEALAVLRRGIAVLPAHAGLRVTAAALYERQGNATRAAEEYQAALVIEPTNAAARKGLKRISPGARP